MSVTAMINFEISNTYSEWEQGFYAAQPAVRKAGIFDLAYRYNAENPEKYMIVVKATSSQAMDEFFQTNGEAVAASGHIIKSTEVKYFND